LNNLPCPTGITDTSLRAAIDTWLEREIANGDARPDTIANYRLWIEQWITWCRVNRVDLADVTRQHVEAYRREMVEAKAATGTISNKLTAVRQFYQSAVNRGLLAINPAAGVKPPIDREVKEVKKNLTQREAQKLLDALPSPEDKSPHGLRDRAIIVLGLLEGLRRVEIHLANVEDIETYEVEEDDGCSCTTQVRILVHGKRKDRYSYPREDTLAVLREYIDARGPVEQEEVVVRNQIVRVTPLFSGQSKRGKSLGRISRRGLNWIVDGYLKKAGLKVKEISCHALRHSCGYLTYKETKDIRAVQDVLGHANINTAAIYAASDHKEKRYTEKIKLKAKD
jgi:integrase/recombinase XerC/integrase/recombinase XerD